jgi:chromosome segregation ATPase
LGKNNIGTLVKWRISNEEFVTAIDYLAEKGIVTVSTINEKENQRQMEYLKAKSEVFKEETKELREENEEYRILLKSQELNRSNQYPTSMSSIFDEYQALQKEVKKLKDTNKKMSENINDWVSNFPTPEETTSLNVNNDEVFQARADQINELNNLKVENKKFEDKIDKLEQSTQTYQDNIELLKLENQNKKQLITALKERNQENRDNANQLIQSEEAFESTIVKLRNESFIQKQKMIEYENQIKSFNESFEKMDSEQLQKGKKITNLENINNKNSNTINQLEVLSEEQKKEITLVTNDLIETNKIVGVLSEQIQEYELTVKSLNGESKSLQNKIKGYEAENSNYRDKISQLELENKEQRSTLMGIMDETQESNEFASILNSKLTGIQEIMSNLEDENTQYKSIIRDLENESIEKNTSLMSMKNNIDELNEIVSKLNSKISSHENVIKILENENSVFQNEMISTSEKDTSNYETLVRQLQGENNEQLKEITLMKIKSDELINSLNSKVITYQGEIKTFKQENSQYQNTISTLKIQNDNQHNSLGVTINQNDDMVKLLNDENQKHQDVINELQNENKILEKKASVATNENDDNIILMSEIESENKQMLKQIELLNDEINSKHTQIENLRNAESENEKISQIQVQKPQITTQNDEGHSTQNDVLLVELNYLKAKGLVNDDEIETLRAENEEYRILLNLLKKGQDSTIGIEQANYDSVNNEGQGVVMYKTTQKQKELPSDWIAKVDTSKKYSIYIEKTPNWSADMSSQVFDALEYWENTANVEFEITNAPSFGVISIGWEKELKNGYDGYVLGQTEVSIGLGSSDCDDSWRPYSSNSIKNILIHELGHTVALEHAVSKSNIMYPMIHDAKFAAIDETISISQGSSVFVKGCSFSADPSYNYKVNVKDSKKVDIFFIPSIEEKYKVDTGKEFNYYSDINCIGLDKSSKSGMCKVADSAGMLIINPDNKNSISLDIHLEEQ